MQKGLPRSNQGEVMSISKESNLIDLDDSRTIKMTKFVCSKCHRTVEQFWRVSIGKYEFCEKCHSGFYEFLAGIYINEEK